MKAKKKTQSDVFTRILRELEESGELAVESAKIEIAEDIYLMMKRQRITQADLARRLGKSRAYVTQILQGPANLTIESLVRISRALGCRLDIKLGPTLALAAHAPQYRATHRKDLPENVLPWRDSRYLRIEVGSAQEYSHERITAVA